MKLLYAYRYGIIGGVSTQLLLRQQTLCGAGHQCQLFFSQDNGLRGAAASSEGLHFGSRSTFARLVSAGHFDAVIVIDSPELLAAAAGPWWRRNPVYLDVHTTTETGLAYLHDVDVTRLAGVMVPSAYSRHLVQQHCPTLPVPLQVTPNILDNQAFTLANAEAAEPRAFERREFIWVGKLDYHKNWRLALVYTALLKALFGEVRVYVVGGFTAPADTTAAFFSLAERLNISASVSWLDRADKQQLAALYRRCASSGGAMLVTSRDESFGMAAAEALLCGCPLISNDLAVFREVFPESPLLQRVDIWSPEQVAAAAQQLAVGVELVQRQAMHDYLAKAYGAPAFVAALEQVLGNDR
ncbi:glycosyltransferase family 4 protein [Ectopseudomonas oleovorans]|uniref:Glycosyl transferase n=1 Tax=Ectopseudomonas oleovorans (strain CECT 5344) TaxID=1182590 RepID=W6QTS0_ECTO5|nr:glycosyltransferase [Pseudomonas oleovorans]CDM40285.1 glycosyl transferase [Pseudomonas oleovorans CECT 5344]CDR90915.1 glycosyl transferase [Pseudomonas oleovorans]